MLLYAVPREGFDLSVIILASLLVFPDVGLPSLFVTALSMFLSSGMHIFKHFYLFNTCQSGDIT